MTNAIITSWHRAGNDHARTEVSMITAASIDAYGTKVTIDLIEVADREVQRERSERDGEMHPARKMRLVLTRDAAEDLMKSLDERLQWCRVYGDG